MALKRKVKQLIPQGRSRVDRNILSPSVVNFLPRGVEKLYCELVSSKGSPTMRRKAHALYATVLAP